jgi:type I restriction enzyme M protein
VINRIDELRFRTHAEKHEMSHLYEDKIKNMGNAGRNGGEYYTPRPLITTIIRVVDPKIGDKIYDGACGSAGFLCEAFAYLKNSKAAIHGGSGLTTKETEILQKRTFYGKEKKSLAYIIGIMNMILHGVEAPNIIHTNTLAENLADIQEKDRYDVVLANPPFGGKERAEVQQNFPIKTGETASLFLQHFIKILKAGGKAGVVIKNTFLSNTDNATVAIRKTLLESCNLHTVLDLPGGTFTGAGVKTVVLFFEKGRPTQKVWYYQLNLDRNLGKTNPLNENDLAEFVELQKTFADSENSWTVNIADIMPPAPKGHNTGTKGAALRDKAATSKAPKGRNSYAYDNAPSGLVMESDAENTGLHPVLGDSTPSGLGSSNYDLSVKNPNKKEAVRLRSPNEILEEMKALDEESSFLMDNLQLIIDSGR